MAETQYIVRVDTKAGHRKTYFFDSAEEANAFVIACEDTVVQGPRKTICYTAEESD